jgi:hypothetical protein
VTACMRECLMPRTPLPWTARATRAHAPPSKQGVRRKVVTRLPSKYQGMWHDVSRLFIRSSLSWKCDTSVGFSAGVRRVTATWTFPLHRSATSSGSSSRNVPSSTSFRRWRVPLSRQSLRWCLRGGCQ